MCPVAQNHMGRGDDTPPSLRVARNRNGLRALTTQESHGFSRVECQLFYLIAFKHGWKKKWTILTAATVIMIVVSVSWAAVRSRRKIGPISEAAKPTRC